MYFCIFFLFLRIDFLSSHSNLFVVVPKTPNSSFEVNMASPPPITPTRTISEAHKQSIGSQTERQKQRDTEQKEIIDLSQQQLDEDTLPDLPPSGNLLPQQNQ